MSRHIATASRTIPSSAETVYRIIADYRVAHPMILPQQYFLSLDVEEGGFGAGTIVNFDMRLLGQRRSFRALITEPDPGRLLVETDIQSRTPTSFRVETLGNQETRVTITTELSAGNIIEGWIAKIMLQKVYREELLLLEKVAGSRSGVDGVEKANEN